MKKFVAILLLVVFALAGCSSSSSSSKDPIKIGHITNLTGASTMWGAAEKNALAMEVEKINAAGGVLGRPIEITTYDFRTDPLEAVNATRRLISDGAVAIIGPSSSGAGIAMAAVTNPANLAMVATIATNPKVTVNADLGGTVKTAFRVCFIDPFQGTVAARFALQDLGAKTYAIMYDVGSDYSQGLEQYFREEMDKNGATMVAREGFRSNEVDFRALLGEIKDTNPDVLYIPSDLSPVSMAVSQAADLGITTQTTHILSGDSVSTPDFVNLGGPASEGVYITTVADIDDPKIAEWVKEYREKYKTDPVLPNPVMAVDALRAIVYAIEQAKSTDREKIVEQLGKIENLPVLSGNLTIDPETHDPIDKPAVVQVVKNGEIKFYKLVESDSINK